MANLTADYDEVVGIFAITGDMTVTGVFSSWALQTFIAIGGLSGAFASVSFPSFGLEAAIDSSTSHDSNLQSKTLRDAAMFLEINKYMFIAFCVLSLFGVPYALINLNFENISNSTADNGILPAVYTAAQANGYVVVAASNSSVVSVGEDFPTPTTTAQSTTTTVPNSSPTIIYEIRCGSTWIIANETCSNTCVRNGDCFDGELCFRDLVSCAQQGLQRRSDASSSYNVSNASITIPSALSSYTINQIDTKSVWYWLPAFLTWIFSFIVYLMLLKLCILFIKHRRHYFSTSEFLNSLEHRTLFLTYIPNIKTDEELAAFFASKDVTLTVEDASINRNSAELGKLAVELKDKTEELERYLTKIFNQDEGEDISEVVGTKSVGPYNFLHSNSASSNENPSWPQSLPEQPKENRHLLKLKKKFRDYVSQIRRQLRTRPIPEEKRKEEIESLKEEINQLEQAIHMIRSKPEGEHPSNESGFVSLATPQQAHRLIRTIRSHPSRQRVFGGMHIKFAPDFDDIYWINIGRPQHEIYVRRSIAVMVTIGVVVGYILLSGILSSLQNLSVLFQNNPDVSNWIQENPFWRDVIQTVLCPIPLAILNFFLTTVLQSITFLQGVKSGSGSDRSIVYKFYVLSMIQIFVFAIVSAMIQDSLNDSQVPDYIITDPLVKRIVTAIQSLAQNSYFYIITLASFYAGFGFEIVQLWVIAVSFIRRHFFKLTPRDEYELNGDPKMDFVQFYGILISAFTISLTFSIISPLILPFAMVFFGITFVVMKYQLMYVYSVERESNGAFFPKIFNVLCFSVWFFQVITFFVILAGNLSISGSSESNAIGSQWKAVLPLPILTIVLWLIARIYLIPRGIYCVDDYLNLSDREQVSLEEQQPSRKLRLSERVFNPLFVKPLPRVMIAPEYQEALRRYYVPLQRSVDKTDPRVRAWALSQPPIATKLQAIARRLVRAGYFDTFSDAIAADPDTLEKFLPPEDYEGIKLQESVLELERLRSSEEDRLAGNEVDFGTQETDENTEPVLIVNSTQIEAIQAASDLQEELQKPEELHQSPPVLRSLTPPFTEPEITEPLQEQIISPPRIEEHKQSAVVDSSIQLSTENTGASSKKVKVKALRLGQKSNNGAAVLSEETIDSSKERPTEEAEIVVISKKSIAEEKIQTYLNVDVVSSREVTVENGTENYVEYEVLSESNIAGYEPRKSVLRRYRDFAAFQIAISREFPDHEFPPLPPGAKVVVGKSEEMLESRRQVLTSYLKEIAAQQELHEKSLALKQFFQASEFGVSR
ncbi:hypothetical protein HDU83_001905 [Entophlyctis luteolus]|nr:hypothetical protein HDU83_001905 [Entophlyctis luteolus]